jgi:tetraacyldisaccharide 4'-kinase
LVNEFLPKEATKCIIEKGYKRKIKNDIILTKENESGFSMDEIGDEAKMLFDKLQIPISISEIKYKGFCNALKSINPEILLLDDGFQHRWIERDLNILILDKSTLLNPHYPPKGRLREPLNASKRADVLLFPKDYLQEDEFEKLPNQIICRYEIQEGEIYSELNNEALSKDIKLCALSGIAHPERFHNSIRKKGIDDFCILKYPDHHNYSQKDITKIIGKIHGKNVSIITTEKDFVKLRYYQNIFENSKINIFVLPVKFKIFDEENKFKNKIIEKYKLKYEVK